jgi:chromosome segregation ATPase
LESDQKDLYISELKAENFELRHRQGHFHDLRDRITSTEHEIACVNDDRRRIEEEMRIRKREDDETIRSIQSDNDALKCTISAREAEIEDLKAQIDALRREDADITQAIREVTCDITGVTGDNESMRKDINGLECQLGDERALGRKLRADLDKARTTLNVKEDENNTACHTIR